MTLMQRKKNGFFFKKYVNFARFKKLYNLGIRREGLRIKFLLNYLSFECNTTLKLTEAYDANFIFKLT